MYLNVLFNLSNPDIKVAGASDCLPFLLEMFLCWVFKVSSPNLLNPKGILLMFLCPVLTLFGKQFLCVFVWVYSGPRLFPHLQVSWKSAEKFLCKPADKPNNQCVFISRAQSLCLIIVFLFLLMFIVPLKIYMRHSHSRFLSVHIVYLNLSLSLYLSIGHWWKHNLFAGGNNNHLQA